ncbi:MAG: hypothetical protein RI885_197 [Actinomycetota bacterium]
MSLAATTSAHPMSPVYRRVVADARQALTLRDIAEITGVKTRSVQNWASGASRPEGTSRDRLLELQYVVEQLLDVYDSEGVDIWMHRPQRSLAHRRPVDAIRDGLFDDVVGAVEHLAGGPRRG